MAVLLLHRAVFSVVGPSVRMIAVGQQRRDIMIGDKPNVPTFATIATIGTALGHHGFAAERHTAGSAITTTEIDRTFVDKLALAHQMSLVERLVIAGEIRPQSMTASQRR